MTDWRARLHALRRRLAVAGLVLALAGIGLDDGRVVWVAIGVLGASVALRLLTRRPR